MFSGKFCEISKNNFFTKHLQTTASETIFITERLRATASDSAIQAFLYKQQFYKLHQAETGKKSSKS